MKARFILTMISLVAYWTGMWAYRLAQSPITGAATARQLDDTSESYLLAKFIREGDVEFSITVILWIALAFIWGTIFFKTAKNTNPVTK
jgi:hypothetical protein